MNTKFEISKLQRVFLGFVPIAFFELIWKMVPVHDALKLAISLFLWGAVFGMVTMFAQYLNYFVMVKNARIAVIITILVFLFCPLAINIMHDAHEREYLVSYPADNQISVRVVCDVDRISSKGSIGDDWTYRHFLNGREFENGDVITIDARHWFVITSRFIERDSISDVGESDSKRYKYSQNDNYKKKLIISNKIHVEEEGGKKNSGATIDFEATYTLIRVIPTKINYWDMFLYTSNKAEYHLCVTLIVGQLLCVVSIVLVLVNGRKKEAFAEEQERIRIEQELEKERRRKEREFLAGKALFIESLKGQKIRQVAGVPPHVSFVNGLPKDNNDAPYGSFTVYCSSSGSCYHDKKGCCAARHPMHYFNAKKKLRPCSKCCVKHRSIPQWYIDYYSLKMKARYYQIDVAE